MEIQTNFKIYRSQTFDYIYVTTAVIVNLTVIENLTIKGNLIINGNENIAGYLRVGSLSAPLNTTAGDITGIRLMIGGTDTTFSSTAGKFAIINGAITDTAAGNVNGIVLAPTLTPSGTSSSTLIGTLMTLSTANNQAFTGSVIGSKSQAILNGSGDIVNPTGFFSNVQITGNSAGNQGLLTVSVNNGGTGYTLNDILTVNGGTTLGTVQVTGVSSGVVTAVTIITPGKGYGAPVIVLTTTGGTGTGCTLNLLTRSSTGITNPIGHQVQAISANGTFTTSSSTTATGIQIIDSNTGSGPITISTLLGMDIKSQTKGTTNNVGLRISAPSGATNNYSLQFSPALTTPAGGITWDNDVNLYRQSSTNLKTDTDFTARHFLCGSGIPTAVAGPGAGSTGTVTVSTNSTDQGMKITIVTSGAAPTANATIFTLSFAVTFANSLVAVVYSPANVTAASLAVAATPFVTSETTTSFIFRSNTTALANGSTYIFNFNVRN